MKINLDIRVIKILKYLLCLVIIYLVMANTIDVIFEIWYQQYGSKFSWWRLTFIALDYFTIIMGGRKLKKIKTNKIRNVFQILVWNLEFFLVHFNIKSHWQKQPFSNKIFNYKYFKKPQASHLSCPFNSHNA